MPDLAGALAFPGLAWIVAAALVAGLVRGFSGFGTAMVFLPVAGQFLNPFQALTVLVVMDMIGPLPNAPRAMRDGHPGDVLRLSAGLLVGMPLGVWALTLVAPETFRWGVSIIALVLLVLLMAGVRYRGRLSRPMILGTGALGGLLGGAAGLPGPPVIMLYMASPLPPPAIRANTLLYLILADVALLVLLMLFGRFNVSALGLGLGVTLPYLAGNMIGARIFRPGAERVYRAVAYAIIAASAVSGLPVWG